MSTKPDYYDVLGVDRTASSEEIRKAFRDLARRHHPDVSKESDAESRFKQINEAYEVLGDSEKRSNYDQFGHSGPGSPFGVGCLLYTSPSPRDRQKSRMPSSA